MKSSICLLFLILPVIAFPQTHVNNQVVGIVYQQNSKIPIARANVSIPGVGSAVNGSNGEFSIGLSQCSNCVVGKAFKIYVNSDYGYGESEYVIPIVFQAEDGIRDIGVTGVQTCALPIFVYPLSNRVLRLGGKGSQHG